MKHTLSLIAIIGASVWFVWLADSSVQNPVKEKPIVVVNKKKPNNELGLIESCVISFVASVLFTSMLIRMVNR